MTSCTVVIATCDEQRLPLLTRAIASAVAQGPGVEVVVAVDNEPHLHGRVQQLFPGLTVVLNDGPRGAAATRNAGARVATGDVLAFLDDDAEAAPRWLEHLVAPLAADPSVVGVGGWVEPSWAEGRPAWFPMELAWVVGASHTGMPIEGGPVRNGWSENMAVRAEDFREIGGFREGFGKIGRSSRPEDTELCLRMVAARPGGRWWLEPRARVRHFVPCERSTLRFLWSRCRAEGVGKAELSRIAGRQQGLKTEVRYAVTALPRGVLIGLLDPLRGRVTGPLRAAAIVIGLVAAAAGFVGALVAGGRPREVRASTADEPTVVSTATGMATLSAPARILEIDLARRLPAVPAPEPGDPSDALALVTLCGSPVGTVVLPSPITATTLAAMIDVQIGDLVRAEAARHGISRAALTAAGWSHPACPVVEARRALADRGPGVTLAVCTRNRPEQLGRCLDSIAGLDYRAVEVLVVDNAPDDDAAEQICKERQRGPVAVRYVREPLPGLSRARNRALGEARHELIAFLDDDEVVDPHWLTALAEEFVQDPEVAAVTGLVLPADLSAMPQVRFEQWGGHSKGRGFVRAKLDAEHQRTVQPAVYPRPTFGAGANMAFRSAALREIGGFDTGLGAGTPARGGEDTLALSEVMLAGHTLVYTPQAVTWHFHRSGEDSLADQLDGYSIGLGAYYAALVARDHSRLLQLARVATRFCLRAATSRRTDTGCAQVPAIGRLRRVRDLARGWAAYTRAHRSAHQRTGAP